MFLGLDQAVCAARQAPHSDESKTFGGGTVELGRCLQRVSGVLAAGTVPIIGVPSIIFRQYIGTFVATFTRFFEDVTTFALDKNGERLISAHLDRTLASIGQSMKPGDRLVIAAHSLGSVVVHNHIVRQWSRSDGKIPDTLITFGSPIGLVSWLWMFLDFEDMEFSRPIRGGAYFCWKPVSNQRVPGRELTWINVVNCLDPIATAFPIGAVNLSMTPQHIAQSLRDRGVVHHYVGEARLSAVGAAHTQYLNDKKGFVALLLKTIALAAPGTSVLSGVYSRRTSPGDRTGSADDAANPDLLAVAAIIAYCGLVAYAYDEWRYCGWSFRRSGHG